MGSEVLSELYAKTQQSDAATRSELAAGWREQAESDPLGVATFLSTVPLDSSCALFEVYEALSELDTPPPDFFVGELERLISAASNTPRNRTIYTQLEAFSLLARDPRGDLESKLARTLLEALDSKIPQVRRFAAHLGGDFIGPDSSELQLRLRELVELDPDWRVRVISHASLRDLAKDYPSSLPPPSIRLMDSLRARLSSSARDAAA
jgi:hypothetical protein